jgi:hypothetical protein
MTLAINIILSAIVLTAIVGSLIWSIVTSRDVQATAPTKIKSLHGYPPTVVGARCRGCGPTPKHPARPWDPQRLPGARR